MRRIALPLTVLLLTLLHSSSAFGWLNTGHRIIADVAWAELSPPERTWVSEILKQHPRYQDDLLLDKPDGTSDAETLRYAFVTAATWPDMVRSQSNPMHAGFSHPAWHYIDIPYCLGSQPPPARPASNRPGPQNIVEALVKGCADINDPKISAPDKAVAMCWILHLCGDIHQPLHCCDMYSPQFPNGDQGGNLFILLRDPPYADSRTNLHFVWDSMPGDFQSRDLEDYMAAGLRSEPRYSREKLKNLLAGTDFQAWAEESHALAIKYAYANGELRGVAKGAPLPEATVIPGLTHHYMREAEHITDQQLILAGYRTADVLKKLFTESTQQARAK
ncbi:MAG TPA: S1/P1 nuclease [Tepidisphaeraceae bacterium]|jgi:hypothetical protein|nr:S1/P1 nuclease [Tepidisphaeraceae bacterium]